MSGDISTQSPNQDKIILRNVIVVAEATEWGYPSAAFDAKDVSNQAPQIATKIYSYITCTTDFL